VSRETYKHLGKQASMNIPFAHQYEVGIEFSYPWIEIYDRFSQAYRLAGQHWIDWTTDIGRGAVFPRTFSNSSIGRTQQCLAPRPAGTGV
jgi:hypothetical protein